MILIKEKIYMHKKIFISIILLFILAVICVLVFPKVQNNTVTNDEDSITDAPQDEEPIINTTQNEESINNTTQSKESIKNNTVQENPTINSIPNEMPLEWQDNGIFKNYYEQAYKKMQTLTQDEKIGQLFLISYPSTDQVAILKQYQFGGYLFFEKDFMGKTSSQVKTMISNLQKVSKVPLLTAADEEGGTVVRISSNPNLASSKFLSPMDLYKKRRICRNRKRYYTEK